MRRKFLATLGAFGLILGFVLITQPAPAGIGGGGLGNGGGGGGGMGDVTGPASSVTNRVCVFADTTGKVIDERPITVLSDGRTQWPVAGWIDKPSTGSSSQAYGPNATAGLRSCAACSSSNCDGTDSVCFGEGADDGDFNSVSLVGRGAAAGAAQVSCMGKGILCDGLRSCGLGDNVFCGGEDSICIGQAASDGNNARCILLGKGSSCSADDEMILGLSTHTGIIAGGFDAQKGIRITESSSVPVTALAGTGIFWASDDVPTLPMFTGDTGIDLTLTGPHDTLASFVVADAEYQSSVAPFPEQVPRNSRPTLAFDEDVREQIIFPSFLGQDYIVGNSFRFEIFFMANGITTGSIRWCIAVESGAGLDHDLDSFASEKCATSSVPATDGATSMSIITMIQSEHGGGARDQSYRYRVARDATFGGDSALADGQMIRLAVRQF